MQLRHYPEPHSNHYVLPYPVIIGVYDIGDWTTAADIYKDWATHQWWCNKTVVDKGTLEWFGNLTIALLCPSYYVNLEKLSTFKDLVSTAKSIKELFPDGDVLIRWIGWEKGGFIGAWPEYYPPVEGWISFNETIEGIKKVGCRIEATSLTSAFWDAATESYQEEGGYNYAIIKENGEPLITIEAGGRQLVGMCSATTYWQQRIINDSITALNLGFDTAYIDHFPYGYYCYRAIHNYPPL